MSGSCYSASMEMMMVCFIFINYFLYSAILFKLFSYFCGIKQVK